MENGKIKKYKTLFTFRWLRGYGVLTWNNLQIETEHTWK